MPAQISITPPTRSDSLKTLPNSYEEIKIYPNQTQKTVRYSSQQPQSSSNEIRIVEENQSKTHQYGESGRESSVRSPLTLSMDSGISSSGIANRRVQGSSVSPSSFPSQASPQGNFLSSLLIQLFLNLILSLSHSGHWLVYYDIRKRKDTI